MRNGCIEISLYGEKNYRLFLDVIKRELDILGYSDITATQALILLNLGENVVTIGEVISRGYYIGSNASYNVKKLIANGSIVQVPSEYDKRAVYLKLTDKGFKLCDDINNALEAHTSKFTKNQKGKFDAAACMDFLRSVEVFWRSILRR